MLIVQKGRDIMMIQQFFSPPLRDCVTIQEFAYFLSVMPDLIRHPAPQLSEKALDSGSSPE
jgi:hypothetical protein